MKNSIIALAILLTAGIAQARSVKSSMSANLTAFYTLQGKDINEGGDIRNGLVHIDFIDKEVVVTLNRHFYCPPGRMCAMVMPAPVIFRAELKKVYKDKCNSWHFRAVTDDQLRDGRLTKIEVVDNSTNTCPTYMVRPLELTEVNVLVHSPMIEGTERHRFVGDNLQ